MRRLPDRDLDESWLNALDAFRVWLTAPDLEPIGDLRPSPAATIMRRTLVRCPSRRRLRGI